MAEIFGQSDEVCVLLAESKLIHFPKNLFKKLEGNGPKSVPASRKNGIYIIKCKFINDLMM